MRNKRYIHVEKWKDSQTAVRQCLNYTMKNVLSEMLYFQSYTNNITYLLFFPSKIMNSSNIHEFKIFLHDNFMNGKFTMNNETTVTNEKPL